MDRTKETVVSVTGLFSLPVRLINGQGAREPDVWRKRENFGAKNAPKIWGCYLAVLEHSEK